MYICSAIKLSYVPCTEAGACFKPEFGTIIKLGLFEKMRYPNHLVDICFVWSQFISYDHIAHVIGNFVCKYYWRLLAILA